MRLFVATLAAVFSGAVAPVVADDVWPNLDVVEDVKGPCDFKGQTACYILPDSEDTDVYECNSEHKWELKEACRPKNDKMRRCVQEKSGESRKCVYFSDL